MYSASVLLKATVTAFLQIVKICLSHMHPIFFMGQGTQAFRRSSGCRCRQQRDRGSAGVVGNGRKIRQKQRRAGPPGQNLLTEGVFVSQLNKMTTAYHHACLSKTMRCKYHKAAICRSTAISKARAQSLTMRSQRWQIQISKQRKNVINLFKRT